jgi:hypothetical protein
MGGSPLQFSQPMSIAYDLSPDSYRSAIAYRAMLEFYTHSVALVCLDSEVVLRPSPTLGLDHAPLPRLG